MGSEKFCLTWTDFESNISVAFRELREEKDFFDVTLVCNEDQIQAHKVLHLAKFIPLSNTASSNCLDCKYAKWNPVRVPSARIFPTRIISQISNLRKQLFEIQSHKVILSACSPFFRSILKRNPHANPQNYFRGVSLSIPSCNTWNISNVNVVTRCRAEQYPVSTRFHVQRRGEGGEGGA